MVSAAVDRMSVLGNWYAAARTKKVADDQWQTYVDMLDANKVSSL